MFSLNKVKQGIYHLNFDSQLELGIHFLRFQEFYESPEFKNKSFQLIDFIKWYIEEYSKKKLSFNYFEDWGGFNIPAETIIDCYKNITDKNHCDEFMNSIAISCINQEKNGKAYLIGTYSDDVQTLNHEVAHGLYYIEPEYYEKMKSLTEQLRRDNEQLYRDVCTILVNMGYDKDVLDDEIQAYFSTGLTNEMRVSKKILKPFEKTFEKFMEN